MKWNVLCADELETRAEGCSRVCLDSLQQNLLQFVKIVVVTGGPKMDVVSYIQSNVC